MVARGPRGLHVDGLPGFRRGQRRRQLQHARRCQSVRAIPASYSSRDAPADPLAGGCFSNRAAGRAARFAPSGASVRAAKPRRVLRKRPPCVARPAGADEMHSAGQRRREFGLRPEPGRRGDGRALGAVRPGIWPGVGAGPAPHALRVCFTVRERNLERCDTL